MRATATLCRSFLFLVVASRIMAVPADVVKTEDDDDDDDDDIPLPGRIPAQLGQLPPFAGGSPKLGRGPPPKSTTSTRRTSATISLVTTTTTIFDGSTLYSVVPAST